MTVTLLLEQMFNGLQSGVMLFLIAAGLTLILGIMDFVFLAHGAQVMIGAYAAASLTALTGNFFVGILLASPIPVASGFLLEFLLLRHLYRRDHMDQVLATFGLILFFNELIRIGFGRRRSSPTCRRRSRASSTSCPTRRIRCFASLSSS